MADKKEIIKKIEGLVLVTKGNRKRLKQIVEKFEWQEDLSVIEALISEESKIIEHTLHAIAEKEIETGDLSIGEFIDAAFDDYFKKFNEQLSQLHPKNLDQILSFAAKSHYEYEHMHPFADGNGRTGRLIVNYILSFFGYPPFIITSQDKRGYYTGFVDGKKLEEYFLKKYQK